MEPLVKQQQLRVGYYGAVSYYDYHFGLMLDALQASGVAQDTVVLVSGDHGWHLGERNMWEKKGLDELDCHVPLLIRVPWIPAASAGIRTSAFAEAVDWMPTLIDLAGLPPCLELGNSNGVSLSPVLHNPPTNGTGVGKQYAFSQFPRCNCTYATPQPDTLNGTCQSNYINAWTHETGATGAANNHVCLFTPASQFNWMGYSIRAESHRYTIFVEWDGAQLRPQWEAIQSEELYGEKDLSMDFDSETFSEPTNLAATEPRSAGVKQTISELRAALIKHFSSDGPKIFSA